MFTNRKSMSIWAMLVLVVVSNLTAQEKIKLSLDEALAKAEESNYEINMAQAEVEAMQADFNKSLAVFLPQITLSETFVRTDDPLNVFGFKLKQRGVTMMDFNPALINDPGAKTNFNTSVDILQPILNFDGFWGRAAAADGLAALKYKKNRTVNYMKFMVKMSYFQINLLRKSQAVVNEALETANANLQLFNNYFDEGLITKADLLQGEVFVSKIKSQKTDVDNQLKNASDNLKHMLAIKEVGLIEPTDTLSLKDVYQTEATKTTLLSNRSDILAYQYKVNAMDNQVTMNWLKFVPRINAFGNYQFNDSDLFGTNAKSWMVGINMQWNIFNGFQNVGGIQKSKAELRHAQVEFEKVKSQGANEIEAAYRDVETAKTQLDLAVTTVEQSKESLRIIKDRYEKGLEKTTDLLNSETTYSGSQLNYLKNLFMYNVSLFKVELMTEAQANSEKIDESKSL